MGKGNSNTEDVNIYNIYLKDIVRYDVISDSKTREYLKLYRDGNENDRKLAKERIVGSHQRFVLSVANKFANGNNLMDVVCEGNIGLMRAMDEYDINSDVKFTTYAMYWIRKFIMEYISVTDHIVTPKNAIKIATYVPKVRNKFWHRNQRQPTTDEIQGILADKYNINFANKGDLIDYKYCSIDEKYNRDEDYQEFMEANAYTAKTAICDTDRFSKAHDEKVIVNQILSKFSERDSYIIRSIYGLDCEKKTIDDLASELGICNERVRQIAVNDVSKMGKRCSKLISSF